MVERYTFEKTIWENELTKLNAEHLNHIEAGIKANNDLAKENANFIDEIFSAFISQLHLTFNNATKELTLQIGSTTGLNPTLRFNTIVSCEIPIVDPMMTDEDLDDCWDEGIEPVLDHISISEPIVSYSIGGNFIKPTVTAHYTNGTSADVTSSAVFSGFNMTTPGVQTVLVSYTLGEITETLEYEISIVTTANQTILEVPISTFATTNEWVSADNEGPTYRALALNAAISASIAVINEGNSGKYYGDWRLFQVDQPMLTIQAVNGYRIIAVKIDYEWNNNGTLVRINAGDTYPGFNCEDYRSSLSNGIVVNEQSVMFAVGNTFEKTNGQVRISKLTVIYEAL